MNTKYNQYKITLEHTYSPKDEELQRPVVVEFDNHDNIFNIIKIMQERDRFNDINQSTEFAIGLKLFSEVMLRNKDNTLFEEFLPEFKKFMQKLKGKE